jgi:hypothetical protein
VDDVLRLEERVALFSAADRSYQRLLGRLSTLADNHVRVLAVLAGFRPEFMETPFGHKVKELTEETYARFLEWEASRPSLADVPTRRFRLADYVLWQGPLLDDVVTLEAEGLKLGPNPSDYEQRDHQGSYIALGDGTWLQVWISLDVKVVAPAGAYFCWGWEDAGGGYRMVRASLGPFEMREEGWTRFIVRVEDDGGGKRLSVDSEDVSGSVSEPIGLRGAAYPGFLVLQVVGEGTTIEVNRMEYKVLQEAEEAPLPPEESGTGADDDDSDDASDGDGEEDERGDEGEEASRSSRLRAPTAGEG